jgi:cytochrome c oxidase subunit IV
MKNKPKESSLTSLFAIYAALLLLLLATVAANTLPLGSFSLLVALLIAIAKALLVLYFFMHLRLATKVTWLFAACGFIWLAMLFTMTFSDYLTRSWSERAQDISPSATPAPPPPGYTPVSADPAPQSISSHPRISTDLR